MTVILFISGGLLLLFELLSSLLLLVHRDPPPSHTPVLSLVIPAHDEEEKLRQNLPAVLEAMNEGDELIVVDDGSTDGSYAFLKEMSAEHPIVLVRNYLQQGKKRSVELACKKATHEHILQTDADCRPASREWIDRMRGAAAKRAELGLGWGSIEGGNGPLATLTRYDTARTALTYSSFAMMGTPYMGVGRNLLYARTLRTAHEMPEAYYRSMSGDDDLLVSYRAKGRRTELIHHPKARTHSPAPASWTEHWTRARRHAEAGLQYRPGILIALGLLRLAELLFPIATLFLLFTKGAGTPFSLYLPVMLLRGGLMLLSTNSLINGGIALLTPLIAFISTMNRTFVEVSVLVSKPTRWR